MKPDIRRDFLTYGCLITAFVIVIAALVRLGEGWFPLDHPRTLANAARESGVLRAWLANLRDPLATLIIQLLVIVSVARLLGRIAAALRQPVVVGEIAAGIALGPSLLGHLAPDVAAFVFPASSLGVLRLLSQIGIILYMFTVGLDLDPDHVRHRARSAVAVSHFSIVTPFLLGVLAALALYAQYAPPGVPFHAFALFMGIAMSITAFPVLARVLEERGLARTPLGSTALTCAAVDDITAWTVLAFVVTLVTAGGAGGMLMAMLGMAALFIGIMVRVVRPFVARVFDGTHQSMTSERLALVLAVTFGSALFTELLGIHALFGAFVAGAVMPASPDLRHQIRARLESVSSAFLLPLFFVSTGLRTNVALLDDGRSWIVCGAIILVAIAGKLVGSMVAARWTGSSWHDAFVLGALMNTRGLMELIALNVGYDLGILSPTMFTMLVLMAMVTTAITSPLIDLAGLVRARGSAFSVARAAES